MPQTLSWWTFTDKGPQRPNNEDRVLAMPEARGQVQGNATLCIVADGMGGHRGGEYASSLAVQQLAHYLTGQQPPDPQAALDAALRQTSREILAAGQQDPALEQMGTTVVLAASQHERVLVANIGDSRAYLWRAGALQTLSTDDRWVADQVRSYGMTEEQARNHMYRNMLTQYLGSQRAITPHIVSVQLQPGDRLLLCTDGLFETVDERSIAQVLAGPPDQAAATLVRLAITAQTSDNVTAAVGYYGPPAARRPRGLLYALLGTFVLLVLGLALALVINNIPQRQRPLVPPGLPGSRGQGSHPTRGGPTSTIAAMPQDSLFTPSEPYRRDEPIPQPTESVSDPSLLYPRDQEAEKLRYSVEDSISLQEISEEDFEDIPPEVEEMRNRCQREASRVGLANIILMASEISENEIIFDFSLKQIYHFRGGITAGKTVRTTACVLLLPTSVSVDGHVRELDLEPGKTYLIWYLNNPRAQSGRTEGSHAP